MSNQRQLGFNAVRAVLLLLFMALIFVLIFPFFARTDRGMRHPSCLSNEKQLGLALLQYYQDYDEYLPSGTQPSVVAGKPQLAGVGWAGQSFTYAKETSLYACPQDHTPPGDDPQSVVSYALNANIVRSPVSQAAMTNPAKTVLLFEVSNAYADVSDFDEGVSKGMTSFSPAGDGTAAFLDGGKQTPGIVYATGGGGKRPYVSGRWPPHRHIDANYLLSDGHAKWFEPDHVSTGTDAAHPRDSQTGALTGRAAGTANGAHDATFSTK